MQIPLLLASGLILFTSCSRYQYATINSSNMVLSGNHEFVAENDTLLLRYNFNGENAPVNLLIENKLNVPVYVDWRQSALIVNDKAISYVPNEVPVIGAVSAAGISWNASHTSYTSSSASLHATATLPASMDFIPPHSHITKSPLGVTNRPVTGLPDSVIKKIRVPVSDGGSYVVRQARFDENNSPIRFRSYLTISVGEAGAKPLVFEHSFYVSELQSTLMDPATFGYSGQQRGNRYYTREETGFGKTATGFGVIAGTAVIQGAAAALHDRNCYCNRCHPY